MTPAENGSDPALGNPHSSSRRRKIGLVAAAFVVVLVLAVVFLSAPSEPSYQGRSLTHWLEAYGSHDFPMNYTNSLWRSGKPIGAAEDPQPSRHEADIAIRTIGTNAIPNLLRLLQNQNRLQSHWQFSLARKFPFFRIAPVFPFNLRIEATAAFRVLGTNAAPAVPQLLEIYDHKSEHDTKDWVFPLLAYIGPPAEPAIPMLLRTLAGTNTSLRDNAAFALGAIHGDAPLVVPALIPCLRDPDDNVRLAGVAALAKFGKAAKSAAPELLELLRDPIRSAGPSYRIAGPPGAHVHPVTIAEMATNALRDIDPETAAKAGIRDNW